MELREIRKEINKIDEMMRELFDARLQCSKQVAETKMQTGDCIFKPEREKEVMARFPGEESKLYRLYIRKVMQLSRFFQYREFLLKGQRDETFDKAYGDVKNQVYAEGGSICMMLETDPHSECAISVQEVLSLLGDFGMAIQTLQVKDTQVSFTIAVSEEQEEHRSMELLFYMLYKESIKCEFSAAKM